MGRTCQLLTQEDDLGSHDKLNADRRAPLLTSGDALQENVANLSLGRNGREQKSCGRARRKGGSTGYRGQAGTGVASFEAKEDYSSEKVL